MKLDQAFWSGRYATGETGWDLGAPSTPLKAYIDQLTDKDLRILIPGGGRSYEAEYLYRQGFRNVHALDLTEAALRDLVSRCPAFPKAGLVHGDFFAHKGQYDLILEQTFFCALDPALRPRYVKQMHVLLAPGGKLAGVLFDDVLNSDHPPFGGNAEEYRAQFGSTFSDLSITPCYNSIAPRAGREVWISAVKGK